MLEKPSFPENWVLDFGPQLCLLDNRTLHLLSNAIKYASETEPIRVSSLVSEELVTVRIQDRGRGIPADHQAGIFERFYRISNPSEPDPPGLGLGLYLTAQLIKQQGGQIWVESIEGMGSTFSFTLLRKSAS